FGVVGALRSDNAPHILFAEIFSSMLDALSRMAVSEPIHHLRAQPGDNSHPDTDKTTAQNQPPVAQGIPYPVEQAPLERHSLLLDAKLSQSQIQRRGNAEKSERDNAYGKTVQ